MALKKGTIEWSERQRDYQRSHRKKIIELLGGICVRCGFTDERALQVDHIKGGGWNFRETQRASNQLLKAVMKDISKYQLLCANCNWIKRFENNEHRGKVNRGSN